MKQALFVATVFASASAFNLPMAVYRAPGAIASRRPALFMQEEDEAQPAPAAEEEAPAPAPAPAEKFDIGGVGPYAIFGIIAVALLAKDYLLGSSPMG